MFLQKKFYSFENYYLQIFAIFLEKKNRRKFLIYIPSSKL